MPLAGVCLFVAILTTFLPDTNLALKHDATNGIPSRRERRAMVFPSGTVLQFSMGLSLPVSVPNRTLTMSVYYQAVFNLPTQASQWNAAPDIVRKREISNTPLLDMYLPLEEFLEEYGFDGRACLLRSICEAAHSPFQHDNMDLLEEMAHAILTPSQDVQLGEAYCSDSSYRLEYLPLDRQYLAAECLGKSDGNCETAYPNCPNSPLDMVSQTLNLQLFTE